jgi:hypothetical protein
MSIFKPLVFDELSAAANSRQLCRERVDLIAGKNR